MEKAAAAGTPVPPYESNPQYATPQPAGYPQHPPQSIQQDSYQIHQATTPQVQYQQAGVISPQAQYQQPAIPQGDVKQEGYFAAPQQQSVTAPQQPSTSQYRTAVPLSNLQDNAAPIDCPHCGVRGLTSTAFENGHTTHMWALVACFFTLLCCIPYLINGTKDVSHKCSSCGTTVARFHRSGRTVVLAHA